MRATEIENWQKSWTTLFFNGECQGCWQLPKKKCPQMDIMTNTNFAFKLKMKIFCFATDSVKNVYMDNLEPILVQN